jgi:hypothetical protein
MGQYVYVTTGFLMDGVQKWCVEIHKARIACSNYLVNNHDYKGQILDYLSQKSNTFYHLIHLTTKGHERAKGNECDETLRLYKALGVLKAAQEASSPKVQGMEGFSTLLLNPATLILAQADPDQILVVVV